MAAISVMWRSWVQMVDIWQCGVISVWRLIPTPLSPGKLCDNDNHVFLSSCYLLFYFLLFYRFFDFFLSYYLGILLFCYSTLLQEHHYRNFVLFPQSVCWSSFYLCISNCFFNIVSAYNSMNFYHQFNVLWWLSNSTYCNGDR